MTAALALSLREIAARLCGEVSGRQVLAPGPGHSPKDRSLSLRIDADAPDGFVVHSFAGDDPLVCRDHVRDLLGLPSFKRGARPNPMPSARTKPAVENNDARLWDCALRIWGEARDPRGTPVELYLRGRGHELPDEAAGEAIRFHPACSFAGERVAAMVCLVRDIVTDRPIGIHRTAISLAGEKVKVEGKSRLALGPISGGAIKITPDADVTLCIGIGEGLESALAMRRVPEFGPSPIWSLISASGIAGFPVVPAIESLWVAVDHDPAGIKAAQTVADRWRNAGREVFLVRPTQPRADMDDVFRSGAHG